MITCVQDQWHEFIQETEALQITQANFVLSRSGTSVYVQNEWHECIQEIEDLHITMTNFTVSFNVALFHCQIFHAGENKSLD